MFFKNIYDVSLAMKSVDVDIGKIKPTVVIHG